MPHNSESFGNFKRAVAETLQGKKPPFSALFIEDPMRRWEMGEGEVRRVLKELHLNLDGDMIRSIEITEPISSRPPTVIEVDVIPPITKRGKTKKDSDGKSIFID